MIAYWLILISPALVPLIAPYLPFQDWPGHVAITAAKRWIDAGTALPEAYAFRGWIGPNRLSYALAEPLVPLLGALHASNVILALGLGALGPAMHLSIRSLGGDPRWALAATALALGRVTACGFGPNVLALPGAVLAIGLYWRLEPRPRHLAALFAALLYVLGTHLFVFLAIAALLALAASVDVVRTSSRPRGLLTLAVIAAAVVVMRLIAFVPAAPDQPSVVEAVWSALDWPRSTALVTYWEWTFAYFRRGAWDDRLQLGWFLGSIAGVGLALRVPSNGPPLRRLLLMVAACLVAFLVLPETIGAPVNWWGGNLRVPTLANLVLILAASLATGRIAAGARVLAALTSGWFVVVSAIFVVQFSRQEMSGFAHLVTRVEPGARLCTLHYSPERVHEFPGEPHWYAGGYALVDRPVAVEHGLFGNPGEPVSRPRDIPAPGLGGGFGFEWGKHQAWCDVFLVRYQPSKPGEPFSGQAKACVRLVEESAPWRLYARTGAAGRCAR